MEYAEYNTPDGVVVVSDDTAHNYEILEATMRSLSAEDVLRMFANYHGLQIFEPEFVADVLDEMGYDSIC